MSHAKALRLIVSAQRFTTAVCLCDVRLRSVSDRVNVALSKTSHTSNDLLPFPFFFSPPITPFSRRYHVRTQISSDLSGQNRHGHRETVLNQLMGLTRPRSWPHTRISLLLVTPSYIARIPCSFFRQLRKATEVRERSQGPVPGKVSIALGTVAPFIFKVICALAGLDRSARTLGLRSDLITSQCDTVPGARIFSVQ